MKIHATTMYGWAVVAIGAAAVFALTGCDRTPTPQAVAAPPDTTLTAATNTAAFDKDGLARPSETMASNQPYGAAASVAPGSDTGLPNADINNNPEALSEVQPTSAGNQTNAPPGPVGNTEQAFITRTSADGLFEARVAQLGAERANDSTVKSYAAMLAQDHTASNERLRQLANNLNVPLSTALSPANQQTIDSLSRLSGAEFDRQFVQAVGIKDHQDSIALYEQVGNNTVNQSVRNFTLATLPTLRAHLNAAQKLPIKG